MSDTDLTLTHIVCDEAKAFDARHPELPDAARSLGMLAWGLLRAIASCPDCGPGVFRTSPDNWHTLVCPQCHGVWRYQEAPAPPPPRPRRPRRRQREEPPSC